MTDKEIKEIAEICGWQCQFRTREERKYVSFTLPSAIVRDYEEELLYQAIDEIPNIVWVLWEDFDVKECARVWRSAYPQLRLREIMCESNRVYLKLVA